MIKKIYRSKLDIENLSRLRTAIPNGVDNFNYKKIVVVKPWGYEYLMFENSYVAVWILYLKPNHSTSMHCHPTKKTSLIVLWGFVVCSTLDGWHRLSEGKGLIIDEAVFHSSKAVSNDGAFIMEIESPPNKKDLVRLKDEYGREHQGYEGKGKMSLDVSDYNYIDFHDLEISSRNTKVLKKCKLAIAHHKAVDDIHHKIKNESGEIICVLQGKLHDDNGNVVISAGEAGVLDYVKSVSRIFAFGDVVYLLLQWQKK